MSDAMMVGIAFVVALVLAVALILLYKRKIVDGELIEGASAVISGLPAPEGKGLFSLILQYASTAVQTVEQLVKSGQIAPDDVSRKNKAMEVVANAARVDEIPYGVKEATLASDCIEAEVLKLPRNQKTEPPDGEA